MKNRNSIVTLLILITGSLIIRTTLYGQRSVDLSDAVQQENKEEILKTFAPLTGEELKQKQDEALRLAIENNNAELCSWLIDRGAPLDVVDAIGKTILHIAVNDPELTKLLVDSGCDIDALDMYGVTPSMLAVDYSASLKILVETGANIEVEQPYAYGKSGYRALMLATNNPESLKILIDAGANIDARTGKGRTALMFAAQNKNSASVELLVNAGAKINVKTKRDKVRAIDFALKDLESGISPEEKVELEKIITILENTGAKTSNEVQDRNTMIKTIVALLLIAVFWIISLYYIRRAFIARRWPTVWGTVRDSGVSRAFSSDESRLYDVGIKYEYKVDGEEYIGRRIRFLRHIRTSNWKALQNIAEKYYPTREVQVYYNPNNPEMSVLEPGKLTSWMVALFIYLAGSGVTAGILLHQLLK